MDCTLYSVFRLIESAVRMQMHTCESWLIFVASCHVGGLFSEIIVLLQLAAIVFMLTWMCSCIVTVTIFSVSMVLRKYMLGVM